jgi:Tfp pilus assembly protein FimT
MAAIAMPSMMGMKARSDLKDALNEVKGAIQGAQRIAMKKGQTCTLTITLGDSGGVSGNPTDCVPVPVSFTTDDGITLLKPPSTSSGTESIVFSFKGTTTAASNLTLVVESTDNLTPDQRCLVVSSPLGIIRAGEYDASASEPCTGTF